MPRFRLATAFLAFAAAFGVVVRVPTTAGAAVSSADKTWMVAAHQSNLAEIAAGKSAQSNASSAEVKSIGKMFVSDHTKLDASLKYAAQAKGVDLPSSPTAAQKQSLATAEATSGSAYDSAWLTGQISGHRMALTATQTEISDGSDAATLKLARTAEPVIAKHLSELRSLAGTAGSVGAGTGGQAATPSSMPLGLGLAGVVLLGAAGGMALRGRRAVRLRR